jgi:hypothetical protein
MQHLTDSELLQECMLRGLLVIAHKLTIEMPVELGEDVPSVIRDKVEGGLQDLGGGSPASTGLQLVIPAESTPPGIAVSVLSKASAYTIRKRVREGKAIWVDSPCLPAPASL